MLTLNWLQTVHSCASAPVYVRARDVRFYVKLSPLEWMIVNAGLFYLDYEALGAIVPARVCGRTNGWDRLRFKDNRNEC